MPVHFNVYPSKVYYDAHTKEEINAIQEALQVPDHNAFFRAKNIMKRMGYISDEEQERVIQYTKYIRFYDGRTKTFGTGLLSRVKKKLKRARVEYHTHDKRKKINVTGKHIKKFPLRIEQRDEQIEALKAALNKKSGIIHCATNSGKTLIAAAIIKEVCKQPGINVLFLVHRISLLDQTYRVFKKHLDIPISTIGGGKKTIPKSGVLIATFQTARGLQNSHSKEFLQFLKDCDIVFLDEIHVNAAKSIQRIMEACQARMRFGLSGTISKKKLRLFKYMSMTGPVIAEIKSEELIRLGRSAKPTIRFIRVDEEVVPSNIKYASAYTQGIIEHQNRNRKIVKEALRYLDKGMPNVMVTVSRLLHGKELLRLFEKKTDLPCEFIQGETPLYIRNKVIARFVTGKLPIMIVSPIFDTGVDIPEIRSWVNAAGGKAYEVVIQRIGRTVRRKKEGENIIYVTDFADFHNKHLLRHSLERAKHYKNEGFEIITRS